MINTNNVEVLAREESEDGSIVEVVQFKELRGSSDVRTAENLFFATQSGMRLKMVRIQLSDSSVRIEPGAIYYMLGDLESQVGTAGGFMKGIARKVVAGEKLIVNEVKGTGEIFLEPTFGHFLLHRISGENDGIIVDKSLFYAGVGSLDVSAAGQKTVSSALFGGEGVFQTHITGTGVAVIFSPVPKEEVVRYDLDGSKLFVDGNFALMRTDTINFRAEKSSKDWISSAISGEGLLQTFQGKGSVWIAPTQGVYDKLNRAEGLRVLARPPGARQTKTDSTSS